MHKYDRNCNCGAINFEINSNDIRTIVNCHCDMCRKINGAAFSTQVIVLDTGFKLLKGEEYLKSYQATVPASKNFCTACGTPIFNSNPKYKGGKIVHLGALNNIAIIENFAQTRS